MNVWVHLSHTSLTRHPCKLCFNCQVNQFTRNKLKYYFLLMFIAGDYLTFSTSKMYATLKMLGLYLHTLIISHKSCKMLSILNKLILQKNLQNIVTNNVLIDKK